MLEVPAVTSTGLSRPRRLGCSSLVVERQAELDHSVNALGVAGGVLQLEAGREQRRVEEQEDKILHGLVVLVRLHAAAQLLDDGVTGVELHCLLGHHVLRHAGVTQRLVAHDLLHVRRPPKLRRHQDARRRRQALRHGHLLHLVAQHLLHRLAQLLARRLFLLALPLLLLRLLEVHALLRQARELLVLEVLHLLHHVLVDRLRHEQHLKSAALRLLNERRRLQLLLAVAGNVVDRLLLGLHARHVVLQRRHLLARLGAVEAQQLHQLLAVRRVLVDAQLDVLAKLLVELLVVLLVLRHLVEHFQALLHNFADHLQDLVLLQVLARDVQWQVLAVHDALHEAEPVRAQVLAVVHDEHTAHVQLDVVALLVRLEHVERRALRNKHDRAELQLALHREVLRSRRVLPVVGDGLVEGSVLLLRHVLRVARPERLVLVLDLVLLRHLLHLLRLLLLALVALLHLLDLRLLLVLAGLLRILLVLVRHLLLRRLLHHQLDVVADELGVLLDQFLQAARLQVLQLVLLEVQRDARAALHVRVRRARDRERAARGRLPDVRLVRVVLRRHRHAVRHKVRRVEADTKLANHAHVAAGLQRLHERLRAGTRDRTQVVDEVRLRHTDAVILPPSASYFPCPAPRARTAETIRPAPTGPSGSGSGSCRTHPTHC
ncbi:heat shock protein 83 [Leishmania tarentolae]|uniref:Heat shock protein 83 n=1 Tax=Leishmania tarentolae TaxID=5689 RepID=A0A640KWE9_LEITA|nr:heat shock protein 83 [Leishmania tarentolae]